MNYKELEDEIRRTYEEGVTLDEAEKLAAKFLHAQLTVSKDLMELDLDARMKKTGVKAIKAALYNDAISTADGKKPTEAALEHTINQTPVYTQEQDKLDEAEVKRSELERIFGIFTNAHIFYRSVSKGRFE